MKADKVYNYAYEAYTHQFNGRSKQAIKSMTNMYKEGVKNPAQARYAMEDAYNKASADYERTTNNSELVTAINSVKTGFKTIVATLFNKDFRKADNAFDEAYKKLYPKTSFIRETIIAERNMP